MQEKNMELEGTLRAFSLPDILQFLSMGKMTGVLSIWREGYSIDLIIKEGRIVNSSALDRPRKLGQMLVYRGFVKRLDLHEVLSAQKGVDRGKLLGQILIERELITKKTLKEALKLQLEEEIWELFSWQEGQFKFEHRKDIDTSNIMVEIDIEPLLIEGSRRQDEWSKIIKNIPNDNIILTVKPFQDQLGENELTLSENEWAVLSIVNGFFDVGSIIDRTGLGKFETYRILNTFMTANLIEAKSKERIGDMITRDSIPSTGERSLSNMRPKDSSSSMEASFSGRSGRKGLGSFFSRNKQTRENPPIQLDFISPLGAVAFFINSLYESLMGVEGFLVNDLEDNEMIPLSWRELLMHYPKADLICISNRRINVKPLEMVIQWEEDISKHIQECYEDSFAALAQLTSILYQKAMERLGDKNATRLTSTVLTDFGANIRFRHTRDFEFRSWIQDLLKI